MTTYSEASEIYPHYAYLKIPITSRTISKVIANSKLGITVETSNDKNETFTYKYPELAYYSLVKRYVRDGFCYLVFVASSWEYM